MMQSYLEFLNERSIPSSPVSEKKWKRFLGGKVHNFLSKQDLGAKKEKIIAVNRKFSPAFLLEEIVAGRLDTTIDYVRKVERKHFRSKRQKALDRSGHRCCVKGCSRSSKLHVHHMDGVRGNNDLGNLTVLCENHHIQLKSEVMGLLWALKAEKDETFRRRPKNAREAVKRTAFLIEEAKYRQKWSHKIRQLTEEFLECREGEVRKMVPSGYTK